MASPTVITTIASASASASAIKSMDRLLRDVLDDLTKEDQGKLMSTCSGIISERMNFTEGVTWIYLLSKMGLVDLDDAEININHEYDHDDNSIYYSIDERYICTIDDDGRIKTLMIEEHFDGHG
jgi:hypothetical protein